MPKDKETSNHPCHFLSLPSARRFWCRHCMSVFEDAITRWRHSRTCRYGVVSNFIRRRELEAKALQNTTKPNPIEARLEQSVDTPVTPPADISNSGGEGSSSQDNGQEGKAGSSFRCFICQSHFSTLEEMRHHVKYPCNHKKTFAEENQAAMTVYIDEFTDRSRPWDPIPQPQQEEVYTSEFVHSLETDTKEHSVLEGEGDGKQNESMIAAPPMKNQDNITPTNIYVNEQGETVIEVENLDLNSEGGELSLAHLLAQLSQQGIVFDKSKTGHMQPRQEMTVSDPASGKVYTTAPTLNYPSITQAVKAEDDEGQPTAEDAANTLAQLAGFRGFRNSQELYEGTQIIAHQPKTDQHIIGAAQGYEYSSSLPIVTASENQVGIDVANSQPELKVSLKYEYYPSTQSQSTSTEQHIALQPIVQAGTQGYNNAKMEEEIVQQLPVHIYEERTTSHGMTYITTTQGGQHHDTASIQTLETEAIGVEGRRVIIDNGPGPVIIQQYGVSNSDSTSEHFVDFPVQLPAVTTEAQSSNPTQELFHHEQHNMGPSNEILCTTEGNICEAAGLSINNAQIISQSVENTASDKMETPSASEQIVKISEFTSADDKETENNSEEFTIQTVSLQEIVEAETSNPITFVDKSTVISVENISPNSQVVHTIQGNHLPEVTLDHVTTDLSIIQHVDVPTSLDSNTQSSLTLDSNFVISESQSSFEQKRSSSSTRQDLPLFVVSSSGLQLVTTDQKTVVAEAQPDL